MYVQHPTPPAVQQGRRGAPRQLNPDTQWRRELLEEVRVQERRRLEVELGRAAPLRSLCFFPRCQEVVREVTHRLASTSRWPRDGRLSYRGLPLYVRTSSLGRVFVELADGRQVGASGFGALWTEDD